MSPRPLALASSAPPLRGARAALLAQVAALRAQADALEAVARDLDVAPETPSAPASTPQLHSRQDTARALSVSLATLDRLDKDGQPHFRIGDAKKYDLVAVIAWHRARTEAEPRTSARLGTTPAAPSSDSGPITAPSGVRRVSVGGRRGAR